MGADGALLGLRSAGVGRGCDTVVGHAVGLSGLCVVFAVGLGVEHTAVRVGASHGDGQRLQDFIRVIFAGQHLALAVFDQSEHLALNGQDGEASMRDDFIVDGGQSGAVREIGGEFRTSDEGDNSGHLDFLFGWG